MKKLSLSAFLCLAMFLSQAQIQPADVKIDFDFTKNVVIINGTALPITSTLEDYEKVLGKAERVEKIAGTERVFAYDQAGISLNLNPGTRQVGGLTVTYIYDGDRKVAKGTYKGSLSFNGQAVNDQTSSEDMAKFSNKKLVEPMKGMYVSKEGSINLMLHYPEGGKAVGQIVVALGEVK